MLKVKMENKTETNWNVNGKEVAPGEFIFIDENQVPEFETIGFKVESSTILEHVEDVEG